jgi:hypothetical protein
MPMQPVPIRVCEFVYECWGEEEECAVARCTGCSVPPFVIAEVILEIVVQHDTWMQAPFYIGIELVGT